MSNYLITSSLESSWQLTKKNYVLNHDALFHYKMNNKNKKFIFFDAYGNDGKIKELNEKFIYKIANDIQKDLSLKLNELHNENYENRYWKIITGHWLIKAAKIIYYRYKCIDRAVNSNLDLFTTASNFGDYNFYMKDSISIHSACINSEWNYNLTSSILRKYFANRLDIKNFRTKNNFLSNVNVINQKKNLFKKLLYHTYNTIQKLSYPLYKKNKYYIKDSYLPGFAELKLNILLNQFPILFKNSIEIPEIYDDKIRKKIKLDKNNISEIEKVIRFFIPYLLPTSYLENYLFIKEQSENLKWPNNPKAIITANAYEFDELFKFWSANKIIKGSKYIIFQHGSLHQNHIRTEYTNEYQVCDKFFNWGSKFKNSKNIRAINFKLFNIKQKKLKKIKILIICKGRGDENETYDRSYEHKKIFEGIQNLVNLLPEEILKNLQFRIKDLFYNNDERDFLMSKNLKILDSDSNIFKMMQESELVVHMYNSTGVLECLSLNIPTMFFFPDSNNCRNPDDDEYISFCKDKEIFYETTELLAKSIIQKFNNFKSWWNDNELQNRRKIICEQYSILPDKKSLVELSKNIIDL